MRGYHDYPGVVLALTAMVLAGALSGCGDAAQTAPRQSPTPAPRRVPNRTYTYDRAAARVPACAHDTARPLAIPRGFPATFPFPPGSAVTSQQYYRRDVHRLVIGGVIPSGNLQATVQFFVRQLPLAGYRLGHGDAEAGEAEAIFLGHGYIGRWRVRIIYGCPTALVLAVFAQPYHG